MVVELPLANNSQSSILSNGIKCCKQSAYDCWLSSNPITGADSLAVIAAYNNGNSAIMARKVPADVYFYIGYATSVGYGSVQVFSYQYANGIMYGDFSSLYNNFDSSVFESFYDSRESAINAVINYLNPIAYPITYHYTNSTVSGPAEAAVGDTVTVSAVPNENYGITDAASQILVTNNDVAVPHTWDSVTNTITFTMPDPS